MAKPEMEIQNVDHIPWEPVEAGVETTETLSHDVWEEIYMLEGTYIDKGENITLKPGMYGCRPPGMKHGPYSFPEGALCLEMRYKAH